MHDGVQQQTLRIYQDVAFLALDLLSAIVARRVNAQGCSTLYFQGHWVCPAASEE